MDRKEIERTAVEPAQPRAAWATPTIETADAAETEAGASGVTDGGIFS